MIELQAVKTVHPSTKKTQEKGGGGEMTRNETRQCAHANILLSVSLAAVMRRGGYGGIGAVSDRCGVGRWQLLVFLVRVLRGGSSSLLGCVVVEWVVLNLGCVCVLVRVVF